MEVGTRVKMKPSCRYYEEVGLENGVILFEDTAGYTVEFGNGFIVVLDRGDLLLTEEEEVEEIRTTQSTGYDVLLSEATGIRTGRAVLDLSVSEPLIPDLSHLIGEVEDIVDVFLEKEEVEVEPNIFSIGDNVILRESSSFHQQAPGLLGEVTRINENIEYIFDVRFNNGYNNHYRYTDLELVDMDAVTGFMIGQEAHVNDRSYDGIKFVVLPQVNELNKMIRNRDYNLNLKSFNVRLLSTGGLIVNLPHHEILPLQGEFRDIIIRSMDGDYYYQIEGYDNDRLDEMITTHNYNMPIVFTIDEEVREKILNFSNI